MANAADVNISLRVSDGPVKEADASVRQLLSTLKIGLPDAAHKAAAGSKGFEQALKEARAEIRQSDRLVNFYVQQIAEIAPVSGTAKAALAGTAGVMLELGQAAARGFAPLAVAMLAFEGIKAVAGVMSSLGEEAKKAQEEINKLYAELVKLKAAGVGITGGGELAVAGADVAAKEARAAELRRRIEEDRAANAGFAGYTRAEQEELAALERVLPLLRQKVEELGRQHQVKLDLARAEASEKARAGQTERAGSILEKDRQAAKAAEEAARAEENKLAKLTTQLAVVQARDDLERAEVERLGKMVELQTQLANGTVTQAAFALEAALAQEQYFGSVQKAIAAQEAADAKHRLELAQQNADLYRGQALQAADSGVNESAGQDLGKNLSQSVVEAQKNAAEAAKRYSTQVRNEWQATGDAIADSFRAVGQAIGGSVGSKIAVVGSLISQMVALAVANQGQGDPYSAFGRVAAMAALMVSTLASLPKYDVGAWKIGSDHVATVHRGEMIVPARDGQADAMRELLSRGGDGGSTFNIYALDAKSFRDGLRANRGELRSVLVELAREGRL